MTMSVEPAALAMREAMRETVRRYSLVSYTRRPDGSRWNSCIGLSNCAVSGAGSFSRLDIDCQWCCSGISLIGARRVPNFWLQLISVVLFADHRPAIHSAPRRGSRYADAASDRVLRGRGLFEGNFSHDTAVCKLGMGLSEWCCGNTAVLFISGQPFSNGDLAAWRVARDPAHQ
jgi:hypothetical protein